jgi:DamX protein
MQSLKEELASKTVQPPKTTAPPPAVEKIQDQQVKSSDIHAPDQASTEKASETKFTDARLKNAKWVMQQNPEHFTLQLVTGRQQATIDRFIAQHGLQPTALAYFYSIRNEKNWHNLIYGVYADRSTANAAIKQLPPELADVNPWIRQFRSIQAEIAPAQ